jgi:hypothetical protein
MKSKILYVCENVDTCRDGSADMPPRCTPQNIGCVHRIPHVRFPAGNCIAGKDICMQDMSPRTCSCRRVKHERS